MKINIIELINELVMAACDNLDNRANISSESKRTLQTMRQIIERYLDEDAIDDVDKQKNMILTFLGSVVCAMGDENSKYYNERQIYLGDAHDKSLKIKNCTLIQIGALTLADMPSYFCGQLFTLPFYDSERRNRELLLFPALAVKTKEIDYLVSFCISNQDSLNIPTFLIENDGHSFTLPTLEDIFNDKFKAFCEKKESALKKIARHLIFQEEKMLGHEGLTEEEIFERAKADNPIGKKMLSFLKSLKIVDEEGNSFQNRYYSDKRPPTMVKNARKNISREDEGSNVMNHPTY